MAAVPGSYKDVQCRTVGHTYRFQADFGTDSSSCFLKIKIYDTLSNLIHSHQCHVPSSEVNSCVSFAKGPELLEKAKQREWIPAAYVEAVKGLDLAGTMRKIIDLVKTQIPMEGIDAEKFVCPISMEIYTDPVLDNCGHTYERASIERILKKTNRCPISRQPITTLTPIHQLRETIAEWRVRDPIPTFSLFKKSNIVLAGKNLETAQAYIQNADEDSYEGALKSYAEAFKYTNDWHVYADLPALFMNRGETAKAQLAYLYLAQYQIEAGSLAEALASLATYNTLNPPLSVDSCLAELYHVTQDTAQAVQILLQAAEKVSATDPKQAVTFYKQAIGYNPYLWEAYRKAAPLVESPSDRAHILLKGACHALEQGGNAEAAELCQLAKGSSTHCFVDRLIDLELKRSDLPSMKNELQALAQDYEQRHLPGEMIKAYKALSYVEYNPFYYEKLLQGYTALGQKDQVLAWTMRWIPLLIENQKYEQADAVAKQGLEQLGPQIPLYEQLEEIYVTWNSHKLCDLWSQLGQAYESHDQLDLAEKVYQQAFDRFHNSFQSASNLALLQRKRGKIKESVGNYYEAAAIAPFEEDDRIFKFCVQHIREIDPEMSYLNATQKIAIRRYLFPAQIEPARIAAAPPAVRASSPSTFGAAEWKTYFVDVGVEPPLPPGIDALLERPCSLWPGKKVKETHMLVLIPQTVKGVPYTLNLLAELVKAPQGGGRPTKLGACWDEAIYEHGPKPAPASHWVLMPREAFPNSTDKNYEAQRALVGPDYEVAHLLDAVTCVLLEQVRSGAFLYPNNPTWVRVQEQTQGRRLVFGAFSASGLRVAGSYDGVLASSGVGVSALRKF